MTTSAKMRIVVVGAAGQARELAWYMEESNRAGSSKFELVGFVVSDLSRLGPRDSRDRVVGDYEWLRQNCGDVDAIALGVGTPSSRLRLAGELGGEFPRLDWPSIVHPSVQLDYRTLSLGRGCMIGPGVVATVNVTLGDFAMLNFGATIGHETCVGEGSVVNPGANVSGGVCIERGVLVGAGAVLLQYRKIGAHATVGAGAVVTKDVPGGVTVVGVPARPVA